MPVQALMVDLDGTLARTEAANLLAYAQALEEYGVTISLQDLQPRIQGRHWKQFLPAVLMEAGHAAPAEKVAIRKAEIYFANLRSIEVNTALVQLLVASRAHLRTALVTSAARRSVVGLLDAHDLAGLFDVVVTGDDVLRHKPDPEAYHIAAQRLGVSPQETLIYEDSDIGVESAKAFGGHVLRIVF